MAQIKLDTILIFTTQFSSMIKASIPLLKSLENLEKDIRDNKFIEILNSIKKDVERGRDFADSLEKHPEAFNTIYVNMVKAGMESGKLATTLMQLNNYLVRATETANKIKAALSYPKFMAIAMVVMSIGMLTFVLPMFEKMFAKAGNELPAITQYVIAMSNFLREHYLLLIVSIIVIIAGLKFYFQTAHGKRLIDTIKLNLPVVGELNKKSSISKFIRTLGVLVQSDIPILKAIKLSKSSAGNVIIEERVDSIIEKVEKGYGISEAFKEAEIFPDIIIQMVHSGEEGGNLDELLISSADYYDTQVENELKALVELINPIMMIVMGLFIAGLMGAIYLPIFEMGDNLGG